MVGMGGIIVNVSPASMSMELPKGSGMTQWPTALKIVC